MTPEYIEELADIADPQQLWRMSPFDQMALEPEQRAQLDSGVALRRHASDVRQVRALLGKGKSRLTTPLTPNSSHTAVIDTPPNVARYVKRQDEAARPKRPKD